MAENRVEYRNVYGYGQDFFTTVDLFDEKKGLGDKKKGGADGDNDEKLSSYTP